MHRTHRMTVAAVAGASLSLSAVVVASRKRLARLGRAVRNDIARRNLNVQYAVRFAQIDAEAEMLATVFFNKHRAYFHKLAEYYQPVVSERGQYLLNMRRLCQCSIGMLLISDLAQQHIDELEKIDARYVPPFVQTLQEIDTEAMRFFIRIRETELPVKMLVDEYGAMS